MNEKSLSIRDARFKEENGGFLANVKILYQGRETEAEAFGNGRLDATDHAIKQVIGEIYDFDSYHEHALELDSHARAASYVSIRNGQGKLVWGVGIDRDIIVSSIRALVSALNRMFEENK